MPGGAQETGENPEEGALWELREECNVGGVVVRQTSHVWYAPDNQAYSSLVDIGDQTPCLGHDPEISTGKQPLVLVNVRWLSLSEITARDRTFLWTAGLLGVGGFLAEVEEWGDDTSYPGLQHSSKPAEGDA